MHNLPVSNWKELLGDTVFFCIKLILSVLVLYFFSLTEVYQSSIFNKLTFNDITFAFLFFYYFSWLSRTIK